MDNKSIRGFTLGIIGTILILVTTGLDSIQTNRALEARVTALENRVTQLERSTPTPQNNTSRQPSTSNEWRRLQNGMTQSQVRGILGEPVRVSSSGRVNTWYYGIGGSVVFFDSRVNGWSEPLN